MTKIKKQKKCRHVDQNDEARGVSWRHRRKGTN